MHMKSPEIIVKPGLESNPPRIFKNPKQSAVTAIKNDRLLKFNVVTMFRYSTHRMATRAIRESQLAMICPE